MTSFREKVYIVTKNIPKGKVLTYKIVAKKAGKPKAWRAVGNILNHNPNLRRIPCHRVVRTDGLIGGYRYGVKRKTSLLKKEGIVIRSGKIVF